MEGNSGFQVSMEADYQFPYHPVHQPFQGEPSSNNFTFQLSNNVNEFPNIFGNTSNGNYPKWTDEMAKLLMIVISYIVEAASSELDDSDPNRMMITLMPNMEKWKVISMVMNERGYFVSPQECEGKFNEIKNKYKRLVSILGQSTSSKVVENPNLLGSIEMPESQKQEVKNLLWSEQFLYHEMCSLYNRDRYFLPHDWDLRRSVLLSIGFYYQELVKDSERIEDENNVLRARWIELEEKKLEVQEKKLEIEKAMFEWQRFNWNEKLRIEKMRLDNESKMLENAKLAFKMKCQEMGIGDDNK